MSGNLITRVERMETKVKAKGSPGPKLVRLCVTDEDVAAVYREAERRGIGEDDVQIIRLVPLEPVEPHLRLIE